MIPCMYCYTQWPQSCSRPPPTHTFTGDPRASPEVSCVVLSPLILSPVSWCARFCCTLQKSISQSCVSSDSPMVGLMATSSKRGYTIPTSVIPRAPVPTADRRRPLPPQEMLKHSSVSVFVGVPGFWCAHGLFEPCECLWCEWDLIIIIFFYCSGFCHTLK